MSKLTPYMFWIVCGVLICGVVLAGMTIQPSADNGKITVEKAASNVDKNYKKLKQLKARADNDARSYDAGDVEVLESLGSEFLLTKKWEAGLQDLLDGYKGQLDGIRTHLIQSSAVLREPLRSQVSDAPDWYFAYQEDSGSLLWSLYDAGLLAGLGSDETLEKKNFLDRQDIRRPFGFITQTNPYPSPGMWPSLTERYRVTEVIAGLLQRTSVEPLANKALVNENATALVPEPQPLQARLESINWSGNSFGGGGGGVETSIPGGRMVSFQARFSGSPSALVALTAAIDNNNAPLFVVRSSELRRAEVFYGGDGENASDADMVLELRLAVLVYSEATMASAGGE